MQKIFFSIILIAVSVTGMAQHHEVRYCGQTEQTEKFFAKHPQAKADAADAMRYLEELTLQEEQMRGGGDQVFIVPVVFHVIHNNGSENISDEQILDAVEILNRDFRKLNEDIEDVVAPFIDIAADVEIEFRLAGLDPDGNCTSGITRLISDLTYDGSDDVKNLIQWPRNRYMNVWICAEAAGAAGWTYMPAAVNGVFGAGEDGIVIKSDYVGSIGTSSVGKSRVLTHEVGHWLNLFHCWGQNNNPGAAGNCNSDDNVADTPDDIGWSSCNLDGASCGNEIDNVQNYMEYSYCTKMFTEGQRTRMRTAIQSNIAQRNQLWTQSNLINSGTLEPVLCAAVFTSDRNTVCAGETIQFNDNSFHGVTEWNWNFGDGNTLSGSDPDVHQNPSHTFDTPGVYTIMLTVGNGEDEVSVTVNEYITVIVPGMNEAPFIEGFESVWPAENWSLFNQNNDATWQQSPSASYSGTNSLKLNNSANTIADNIDEMISTTYDMSAMQEVYLSYKWAYANKQNETDDRLRISVTGDCGDYWYLKKVHKGLTDLPTVNPTNFSFAPTGQSQWTGNELALSDPDWLTEMFRIKFEFIGKGGNNIWLDDINISGLDTNGTTWTNIQPVAQQSMLRIFPNPTSTSTTLEFSLQKSSDVKIELYNSIGALVEVIAEKQLASGTHNFSIAQQPRGLYTVRLEVGGVRNVRKIVFE
ncbi:MAG: M43 family zinc metalloprotease [Flavobacteriales bacterium]|nr:M43 family zinc metalloprotease [Flavobacteriales bacterium]